LRPPEAVVVGRVVLGFPPGIGPGRPGRCAFHSLYEERW